MASNRILITCVGLLAVALSACASRGPSEPVDTRTFLVASNDVNPDISGRPSPVVVRVFQLRGDAEFLSADFFTLYSKEKMVLGASLIAREEFVVQPGERRETRLGISPDARYIAVIAAFRDINGAHWRQLQLRPRGAFNHGFANRPVRIRLERDALTLALKK
jgi:type VI secretion system protein VasD